VFENRVLRKVFGPKRDEVIEKWGKLYDKKFYDLQSSINIIKRWAEHVVRMG